MHGEEGWGGRTLERSVWVLLGSASDSVLTCLLQEKWRPTCLHVCCWPVVIQEDAPVVLGCDPSISRTLGHLVSGLLCPVGTAAVSVGSRGSLCLALTRDPFFDVFFFTSLLRGVRWLVPGWSLALLLFW